MLGKEWVSSVQCKLLDGIDLLDQFLLLNLQKDWIAHAVLSANVLGRSIHPPKLHIGITAEMPCKLNLQIC